MSDSLIWTDQIWISAEQIQVLREQLIKFNAYLKYDDMDVLYATGVPQLHTKILGDVMMILIRVYGIDPIAEVIGYYLYEYRRNWIGQKHYWKDGTATEQDVQDYIDNANAMIKVLNQISKRNIEYIPDYLRK